MIDPELFVRNSPFRVTHNDSSNSYNLTNTTPDLLKFQLQEQYRTKLSELKNDATSHADLHLLNTQFLEDSFNQHLQSNLDHGNITLTESLPSLSSSSIATTEDEDFEIDSFILNTSNKPNYLNLKVLIENSILDTSRVNKDSILTLASLRSLKAALEEKKNLQSYLVSKISISQEFISNIILKGQEDEDSSDLDAALLLKILKSNTSLQDQLFTINADLEQLTTKLTNHNLACLVLGYVEDVKLSSSNKDFALSSSHSDSSKTYVGNNSMSSPFNSPRRVNPSNSPRKTISSESVLKSFDSMFSHIASVAAQRNITLPPPPSPSQSQSQADSVHERTIWAQRCIDAIVGQVNAPEVSSNVVTPMVDKAAFLSNGDTTPLKGAKGSPYATSSPGKYATPAEKVVAEYKTALNDMRFSHQYLTKEYEISRESSSKLIQEYRKRISGLEKELHSTKSASGTNLSSINQSNPDDVVAKDKEIAKLRKELNMLRIDRIGASKSNGSSLQLTTSPRMNHGSYDSPILASSTSFGNPNSVSPMIGESLSPTEDDEEDSHSVTSGLSSTRPTSVNGLNSSSGLSNGILRKEFKKIVSDIQDQHEVELSEERIIRRKLQAELDRLRAHT